MPTYSKPEDLESGRDWQLAHHKLSPGAQLCVPEGDDLRCVKHYQRSAQASATTENDRQLAHETQLHLMAAA
jgi:hypothetical protein